MSEARCPAKAADLPLKKRAMKKQFSPPGSWTGKENGEAVGALAEEGRRAMAVNARVLRGEDGEAFDNIMQKQLEIVEGSAEFYRRVDASLREGRVEPYFVKEQWDLYAWREKFFNDNFPPGSWVSDGEGVAVEEVVPAQVAANFTDVMRLASSTEERGEAERHYFSRDAAASERVRNRFSRSHIKGKLEEEEECLGSWLEREAGLTFPQLAHMVVEFHQDGLSLVFGCEEKRECDKLREVLKSGQAEEVAPEVRERAEEGWYSVTDSPPSFLTGEGKKIFNDLRAIFSREKRVKTDKKKKVKV